MPAIHPAQIKTRVNKLPHSITLGAIPDIPLIAPGDPLAKIIYDRAIAAGMALQSGDVLVIAQKIVSKSENRYADLRSITPSARAREIAAVVEKDPRFVEAVLQEASDIVRYQKNVLIVAHRIGVVMANAGIDQSNIDHADGAEKILLLPQDPDASAERLRTELLALSGADVAIIINDSVGRAWRNGITGIAIGVAGLTALQDLRGEPDLFGRRLEVTEVATADELAAAGSLLQGQGSQGQPVVLIRGFVPPKADRHKPATALVRDKRIDMFR